MRNIMIAMIVGLLPTSVAAELPRKTTAPPHEETTKTNPCAAYGAGFVKVAGSSTCVKVGGTVRVEGGRSH
jgi:Porin subfamily